MKDELWERYLVLTGKLGWRREWLGNTKLYGKNNFSRLYHWLREFECYSRDDALYLQGVIWLKCKNRELKQDLINWKKELEGIIKNSSGFKKPDKKSYSFLVRICEYGLELIGAGNLKDLMGRLNEEKEYITTVPQHQLKFFYSRIRRINGKTIVTL